MLLTHELLQNSRFKIIDMLRPAKPHLTRCSTFNAVFRLEGANEVLDLTYLGKYFACVNVN